jgi:ABC-type uncharacterized transport system ATPase component
LDFQHYKNEIAEMLGRGRLAVQLHAAEQTIEMSDGSRQLLYLADSWAVMDDLIPLKVHAARLQPDCTTFACTTKTYIYVN